MVIFSFIYRTRRPPPFSFFFFNDPPPPEFSPLPPHDALPFFHSFPARRFEDAARIEALLELEERVGAPADAATEMEARIALPCPPASRCEEEQVARSPLQIGRAHV